MKKLIYYSLVIVLFAACQRSEDNAATNTDTVATAAPAGKRVAVIPYTAEYNEQTQKLELIKVASDISNASAEEMVEALNFKYPKIQLSFLKTDPAGVAHVKIADAGYLTENMGSSGAHIYMAEATYALTEISGIKSVDFSFQEGSHVSPGIFTRADFKE